MHWLAASRGVRKVHKLPLDKVKFGGKEGQEEGRHAYIQHAHTHTQLGSFLQSTDKVQGIVEACSLSDNLASYPGSS